MKETDFISTINWWATPVVPVLWVSDPKGTLTAIRLTFSAQDKELGIHHSANLRNLWPVITEQCLPVYSSYFDKLLFFWSP